MLHRKRLALLRQKRGRAVYEERLVILGRKSRAERFYKRRGAKIMEGVRYLLPPLAGGEPTEMILMLFPESKNETLSSTVVKNLITQIYRELYGRPEDDALLGTFVHDVGNPIKLI